MGEQRTGWFHCTEVTPTGYHVAPHTVAWAHVVDLWPDDSDPTVTRIQFVHGGTMLIAGAYDDWRQGLPMAPPATDPAPSSQEPAPGDAESSPEAPHSPSGSGSSAGGISSPDLPSP